MFQIINGAAMLLGLSLLPSQVRDRFEIKSCRLGVALRAATLTPAQNIQVKYRKAFWWLIEMLTLLLI
ncbi:hypothetical protein [Cylindrospermum sp. FACHB-282]|uniref:hypothetical protein n=1 Tax=Cylindrospermum sp. FACHB-282 TaxID=2692794 RepID=UPI001682BDF1|nr:hypothetical protein [Cylindrospermum sp. FACHB-282]MBD2387840.1 hypothetical protein [Cylindrospermum sp. FACHB-282]